MRELAPFVLLVCACGAAVRQTNGPAVPPAPIAAAPATSTSSTAAPTAETLAAFETLSARGPSVAPGMREVARKESAADPVDLARAEGRDACLRVAFNASVPVQARLVDAGGNTLATTAEPVTDGVLGARGPVCIRKGEVLRGVAGAPDAHVRWVAWEAP